MRTLFSDSPRHSATPPDKLLVLASNTRPRATEFTSFFYQNAHVMEHTMQRNLFILIFFLTQADPSKQAKRSHTREASLEDVLGTIPVGALNKPHHEWSTNPSSRAPTANPCRVKTVLPTPSSGSLLLPPLSLPHPVQATRQKLHVVTMLTPRRIANWAWSYNSQLLLGVPSVLHLSLQPTRHFCTSHPILFLKAPLGPILYRVRLAGRAR